MLPGQPSERLQRRRCSIVTNRQTPAPRRGELWLAAIPWDKHQPRPCLVISDNTMHLMTGVFLVVPVWTSAPDGPAHVPLQAGLGGIQHDSFLVCEEMLGLPRSFLGRRPLGPPVPVAILKDVVRAIRRAIGDPTVD